MMNKDLADNGQLLFKNVQWQLALDLSLRSIQKLVDPTVAMLPLGSTDELTPAFSKLQSCTPFL